MSTQGGRCDQCTALEIPECLEHSTHLTEALLDLPDLFHHPGDLHLWSNRGARGDSLVSPRVWVDQAFCVLLLHSDRVERPAVRELGAEKVAPARSRSINSAGHERGKQIRLLYRFRRAATGDVVKSATSPVATGSGSIMPTPVRTRCTRRRDTQ